jgi:sulfatase modifying factor 1
MPKPIYILGSFGFALIACSALAQPNQLITANSAEATKDTPQEDAGAPDASPIFCPEGMAHVSGEYCPKVQQPCLVWKDPICGPGVTKECRPLITARCQTFAPSVCLSERVHKDFCIDITEYTKPGETLPMNHATYNDAVKLCKAEGKRTCKETEWTFACEGEEMLPYTTGLERPDGICNIDIPPEKLGPVDNRTDYRMSAEQTKDCRSPFGVLNLNGNLDENMDRETSWGSYQNILKGGHWMPIRARCRPSTNAHNENFAAPYVGFRCCQDTNN